MPENLMNSAHKSSTDNYRTGWDATFGAKERCPECRVEHGIRHLPGCPAGVGVWEGE